MEAKIAVIIKKLLKLPKNKRRKIWSSDHPSNDRSIDQSGPIDVLLLVMVMMMIYMLNIDVGHSNNHDNGDCLI